MGDLFAPDRPSGQFAALSHPSQKRFDLVPRQILSLINNNKLIRNASSPNVCQRLYLNRSDSCQNRFKFTRLFALNKNSRLSKIGCIHGLSFSSFRPANIRYPFPPGRWDARRSVFINTEILRLQKPCRESKQGFSVPAFPIRVTSGISSLSRSSSAIVCWTFFGLIPHTCSSSKTSLLRSRLSYLSCRPQTKILLIHLSSAQIDSDKPDAAEAP